MQPGSPACGPAEGSNVDILASQVLCPLPTKLHNRGDFEQFPEPEYLATTSSAIVKDFSSQNSGGSSSGLLFVQSVGLPDCRWQIRW